MRSRSNKRALINATSMFVVLLYCFNNPQVAGAESTIKGNVINAPTKIENSANIAAGKENKASQFSIVLKNSRINGTVVNSAQSKNSVNVAAGKRNVANQGSVSVSRGTVTGVVSNNVTTRSATNIAAGKDNRANQSSVVVTSSKVKGTVSNSVRAKNMLNAAVGSRNQANQSAVVIKNSSISGKVINSAVGKSSVNLAAGKNNSASQAAIVLGGAQVVGTIINKSESENAINAAVGFGNEAIQSSIVLDGEQAGTAVTMGSQNTGSGNVGQGVVNLLPMPKIKPEKGETKRFARTGGEGQQDPRDQQAAQHVPGQVVFLVDNDKAGLASLDRVAEKYHLNVGEKTVLKSINRIMVLGSTAKDAEEVAEALKNESGVYNSQPNYVFETMSQVTAKDPLSPMQNLVSMLNLEEVHDQMSGKNITVAVVDTGVEVEHQDLRSRIVGYKNFISGSVYQGEIHGTAVAGIIGADKNEYGIVGIAPDVSLLALRACRQLDTKLAKGECFSTSLVPSLDAAISAEVDVVNLSLGAHVNDTLLSMMIDSGHEKGIIFAAPVGNDPEAEAIAFPASHEKVISIAGLDEQGNPLPNERLASMADAVAPATHLFVTIPGNGYNFIDGTSLASASISGIIALSKGKKKPQSSRCLPHFNSDVPWARQVFACIGL